MDGQETQIQDVAAPALVVDDNDEIVGFDAEKKEGE